MTPSTCSEDLLALGESSNENSSSDDEESSENQEPESKRENLMIFKVLLHSSLHMESDG